MQLLYQELGQVEAVDDDTQTIPMGAYVSRIASAIGHLEARENIRLNIRTESFDVSIDTAARIGLIASEIITNAFQHAFVTGGPGLIEVSLRHLSRGAMRLEVMDDGNGMPDNISWPDSNTMGASIVRTLSDGLGATLAVVRGATGTTICLDVPFAGETKQKAN